MKTILSLLAIALVAIPSVALAGNSPGNGPTPVTICHHAGPTKTITITVDENAVAYHVANHGDTIGPCPVAVTPPPVTPPVTPVTPPAPVIEVVIVPVCVPAAPKPPVTVVKHK